MFDDKGMPTAPRILKGDVIMCNPMALERTEQAMDEMGVLEHVKIVTQPFVPDGGWCHFFGSPDKWRDYNATG